MYSLGHNSKNFFKYILLFFNNTSNYATKHLHFTIKQSYGLFSSYSVSYLQNS